MKTAIRTMCWLIPSLLVLTGGCATQGGPGAEASNAGTSAPSAAATPQPPAAHQSAQSAPQLPPPSAAETQYGLQITQIGLTASGGLVDVRFKVLDAAKARALLGNPANAPMLIASDNPPLMPPHHALKGAKFAKGQVFYILYPNQRNAIRPGVEVTVAMGDVRLGPVAAQ